MTAERYGIGINQEGAAGVVALEVVGIVQEPRGEWSEGPRADLADGYVRYTGNPIATWTWDFIRPASRNALRVYCTGPSATVYIQTIDNEEVFKIYKAILRWPEERPQVGFPRRNKFEFVVEFLILEEAVEESL